MRQRLALLLSALAVVAMVPSRASAGTILQFTELTFNNPFTITQLTATSSQITASMPIGVIFDTSFCLVAGCGGATNGTYNFNLNATSTGQATLVNGGNDINQPYAGTFSITNGGINLLTVNFSDLLAGSVNGASPTLASSDPPDTFTGSSNVLDPLKLGVPRGFSFSLSDFQSLGGGGLNRAGSFTVASATADVTGTISAEPVDISTVPEPSSVILLGSGLVGAILMARRRRKQS